MIATSCWSPVAETDFELTKHRLSLEIKAFEAYTKLSSGEEIASDLVASDLSSLLETHRSVKPPISIIGSHSTGLATTISDVDVSIAWNTQGKSGKALQARRAGLLTHFKNRIQASSLFSNATLIIARVPLVRAEHRLSGLQVEVQASATSESQQECTRAFLQEFPSLRPIYIIFRYCLEIRDLKTVYTGGLGSYCVLMMIVTALKDAGGLYAKDDHARQLLHVLHFYATIDLYNYGLSIIPAQRFRKGPDKQSRGQSKDRECQDGNFEDLRLRNAEKPYLLCLQDPIDDSNDLGRAAYSIKHVQATFKEAHTQISKHLGSSPRKQDDPQKGGVFSYLAPLLSADYTWFECQRSKVERYANPQCRDDHDYHPCRLEVDRDQRRAEYIDLHGLVRKESTLEYRAQPTHIFPPKSFP